MPKYQIVVIFDKRKGKEKKFKKNSFHTGQVTANGEREAKEQYLNRIEEMERGNEINVKQVVVQEQP